MSVAGALVVGACASVADISVATAGAAVATVGVDSGAAVAGGSAAAVSLEVFDVELAGAGETTRAGSELQDATAAAAMRAAAAVQSLAAEGLVFAMNSRP
jgi:hypothetical protein